MLTNRGPIYLLSISKPLEYQLGKVLSIFLFQGIPFSPLGFGNRQLHVGSYRKHITHILHKSLNKKNNFRSLPEYALIKYKLYHTSQ